MASAFAVIGPGRVGTALAVLWQRAGWEPLGFVGRDLARTTAALAHLGGGAGRRLELADLARDATAVLVAVPDDALASVVDDCVAAGAVRQCSLWLHASGSHDRDVLAPLRGLGARIGALHPLSPVPSIDAGIATLPGRPAVLQADANAERLLESLARAAGLVPLRLPGDADRALYHAACALAANGVTALLDLVVELLEQRCGMSATDVDAAIDALVGGALELTRERGAAEALSGPVVRGDVDVVRRHRVALRDVPSGDAAYVGLMRRALDLGIRSGRLSAERARAVDEELGDGR